MSDPLSLGDDALAAELRAIFRDEGRELLDELHQALAALDRRPSVEAAQRVMRVCHTLKGSAATAGFPDIARLVHRMEDRLSGGPPEPAWVPVLLDAASVLHGLLDEQPGAQQALPSLLQRLGVEAAPAAAGEPDRAAGEVESRAEIDDPRAHAGATIRIDAARFERLARSLSDLGALAVRREHRQRPLLDLLDRLPEIEAGASARAAFARDLERWMVEEQLEVGRHLRMTASLQEALTAARMVPLSLLAPRFRRAVLDATSALGKRAALSVDLGSIELDRDVLEVVSEVAIHLLRNAVAHGIAQPGERALTGKPAEGLVRITASAPGGQIKLTVDDDGLGIDLAAVERRAASLGVSPPAGPRAEAEILDLLFLPGFSTKDKAETISGRGAGLDAARSKAERLGGQLSALARGELGGASFRLEVPATTLVSRGILVSAGGQRFAVGLEYALRVERIAQGSLEIVDRRRVLAAEGKAPLPALSLAEVMGLPAAGAGDTALVLRYGASERALLVDEVIGEAALAIRPLPWNLRAIPGVQGLLLLPDGALAPVLDAPALFRAEAHAPAKAEAQARRVLVVDDSATERASVRAMLAPAGFALLEARDGAEAFDLLDREAVDVILSDVQMPIMDGTTLCQKIRKTPALARLPVILFSSRGRPEEIERGLAAGADAYLVKGTFQAPALIAAIRRQLP